MTKVIVVGDDRFLKNISETSRILQKLGNLSSDEAEDVINRVLRGQEVAVELEDISKAQYLAADLNQVAGVKAAVESQSDKN